jgi:protein SCO1/2
MAAVSNPMRNLWLALALLVCNSAASHAGLVTSSLDSVDVKVPPDARMPLQSHWRDEQGDDLTLAQAIAGRPTLLIFADYTCSTLCGPALTFVADALGQSGLASGDYRLVVLGIDPKDGPGAAAAMKRKQVGGVVQAALLTGDEATIREATGAVGYRFSYDAEHDQFAHPEVVLVLSGDGRVTRVLSALGIDANDFRLALTEASRGRIGSIVDHVRLLCYGFDPSIGAYTVSIQRALAVAGAITVVMLGVGIGWLAFVPSRMRSR